MHMDFIVRHGGGGGADGKWVGGLNTIHSLLLSVKALLWPGRRVFLHGVKRIHNLPPRGGVSEPKDFLIFSNNLLGWVKRVLASLPASRHCQGPRALAEAPSWTSSHSSITGITARRLPTVMGAYNANLS